MNEWMNEVRSRRSRRVGPFALAKHPAGDDPQGDHKDQEDGARTDGHQRFQDESGVEIDAVEGADAAWRRVGEQFAVQQHDAAYEVETQEHGQTQRHVHRYPLGADDTAVVGQFRRPQEVVLARDRVHGADGQFERDLANSLPRHGYPPVVCAVVDQE